LENRDEGFKFSDARLADEILSAACHTSLGGHITELSEAKKTKRAKRAKRTGATWRDVVSQDGESIEANRKNK
jgi:hypothetical protein